MGKLYTIVIKETVIGKFEIEAENESDAIEKGIQKYKEGKWVLEPGDLEKAIIAVIDEKGDYGEWETIFD